MKDKEKLWIWLRAMKMHFASIKKDLIQLETFFFLLTRVNSSDLWPDHLTGLITRSGFKIMLLAIDYAWFGINLFKKKAFFSPIFLGLIIFDLVRFLYKKIIKLKFKKKTETGSNWPISIRFGFLRQKPVQTGLARFFSIWVRFSFFINPKLNRSYFSKF